MNKLTSILKIDLSYNDAAKNEFHKIAKSMLRKLAKEMGLKASEFTIRGNRGGIAVSGEITLHADDIYVQISKSHFGDNHVLFRTCTSKEDYTGGNNHLSSSEAFDDIKAFAHRLNNLRNR